MHDDVIYIGVGGNLPATSGEKPEATLRQAIKRLPEIGLTVDRVSPFYRSAPVPVSDQPWYVNGVAAASGSISPAEILTGLHEIERTLGRTRRIQWEARIVDLDLLAVGSTILGGEEGLSGKEGLSGEKGPLILPHPRMHQRAFVLLPLFDLVPDWRHPLTGAPISDLIAALDPSQEVERMPLEG